MILFFFSERDIALIIKYEFHDETRSVQELNSQEFKNKNHENDENLFIIYSHTLSVYRHMSHITLSIF
jgi:hypothetical protein